MEEFTVANKPEPTPEEITAFLRDIRAYAATLPKVDQELLRCLVVAGLGLSDKDEDTDVSPYWDAFHNSEEPAGGPDAGTTDTGPQADASWNTTPWGAAYRAWSPGR